MSKKSLDGCRDWFTDALPHEAESEPLCIRWVNTVSWRGKPSPTETLLTVDDWLTWCLEEGAISERESRWLAAMLADSPTDAETAFQAALDAREATYGMLLAKARGAEPSDVDRSAFLELANRAIRSVSMTFESGRLGVEVLGDGVNWESPLRLCALSAARLLLSKDSERLRACERPECAWIFLDTTKNRSRKWCDMGSCGNVVKARRSYARKRAKRNL